jgi:phenylacetate-CoA ligase
MAKHSKKELKTFAVEQLNHFLSMQAQKHQIDLMNSGTTLSAFPIITKSDIRQGYDHLLSEKPYKSVKSSGTTGEPFAMPYNKEAYQKEYAHWWFHRSLAGIKKGDRVATIMGHKVVPFSQKYAPFWMMNQFENQLIFSSFHMSPENLKYYVDALNHFKPVMIHAYPSSVYLLAKYILENNITLQFQPKMIQCASETTLDFQRSAIEQAFQSKVYIWYGNTEYAGHIIEWPDGKLRVHPWHSAVRILDVNGIDVQPGEEGNIVATNFTNTCFPLINYNTRDVARFTGYDEDGWMLVDYILGRIEDYIITHERRYVGRLDHLFKDAKYIRNSQLEQEEIGKLIIHVEKEPGYSQEIENIIRKEAAIRLGADMELIFDYNQPIEKNTNGKFKFIIQHLDFAKMGATHPQPISF